MNAINPATVETNFFTAAGMTQDIAATYMSSAAKTHPIGRIGTPRDCADLCYFLTDSDKAGWLVRDTPLLACTCLCSAVGATSCMLPDMCRKKVDKTCCSLNLQQVDDMLPLFGLHHRSGSALGWTADGCCQRPVRCRATRLCQGPLPGICRWNGRRSSMRCRGHEHA